MCKNSTFIKTRAIFLFNVTTVSSKIVTSRGHGSGYEIDREPGYENLY